MNKKITISIIILVFLAITGVATVVLNRENKVENTPSVEEYIKTNISELSPVKEQLGGKFFVTKFEAQNGSGVVEYEDGHNAYTADFAYEVSGNGNMTITYFNVRP